MMRTMLVIACLGATVVMFTGCGGDEGEAPPWSAREDLTGRWVLSGASVNGAAQDLSSVVVQIGADGAFQRWEGSLGNWARGIVLTSRRDIRFQVNEASGGQPSPVEGWEGKFSISDHRLRITRQENEQEREEEYSRLRPSVPGVYVGDWLLVASKQDGVSVEVDGVVTVGIGGTGGYQVTERGVGVREAGMMEFSQRGEVVTTVQTSAAEPGREGEITASGFSYDGGVLRLRALPPPQDEMTLAREIGALDQGAQGIWLLTETVSQGLRRDAPLGAAGIRMELFDRSGNMLWWDGDNPRGQTANMVITTYAGGYVVLQRTAGVWPAGLWERLRVRLAQLGAEAHYAGQWQVRAGKLWLGEGGLNPAYPFEAFANIYERQATSLPGPLAHRWQLRSRTINAVPTPEPAVVMQIRSDGTVTRTIGEGAVTQTGNLKTYGGRALLYHVTTSTEQAEVGTYLAAHYQISGSDLRLIYVDAQQRGVVEVYERS